MLVVLNKERKRRLRELPGAQVDGRFARQLETAKALVLHDAEDLELRRHRRTPRSLRGRASQPASDDGPSLLGGKGLVDDGGTGAIGPLVVGECATRQHVDTKRIEVAGAHDPELRLTPDLGVAAGYGVESERVGPVGFERMIVGERHRSDTRASIERLTDAILERNYFRGRIEPRRQADICRHDAIHAEPRIFCPHGPQGLNQERRGYDQRDRNRHLGDDKDAKDSASRASRYAPRCGA